MTKAIWEGAVLAESQQCVEVEDNLYFPPDDIREEHFKPSASPTVWSSKVTASYNDGEVGDKRNHDAAYPKPIAAVSRSPAT